MKSTSLTRCGLSAALVAGGLFGLAPAASAIPRATCDPQADEPVLTLVEGLVTDPQPLTNDGLDCVDLPDRPRSDDDSGDDGRDSRTAPDPAAEEEIADDSGDPLTQDAEPPASSEPEAEEPEEAEAEPESDSQRREEIADAVAEAVIGALEMEDFSAAGSPNPVADAQSFFAMLETQVVELISAL